MGAARLVRDGEALPVSLSQALLGDRRHNVYVHPGDLLFVPSTEGRSISVLGEVESPGVVPFRPGLRLSELLARTGGMTDDADEGDIRILRGPLSAPEVYQASFSELVAGEAADVALQPGDVVYVTTEFLADVGEVLDRVTPLLAGVALVSAL